MSSKKQRLKSKTGRAAPGALAHAGALGAACLIFWLVLWKFASYRLARPLLLPSPELVLARLVALLAQPNFYRTVATSLWGVLLGFLLGLAAGALLAWLTAHSRVMYSLLALPMGMVKSTPVASFIVLALVWLGARQLPVFIAFLMVLPSAWGNLHEGLRSADPKLLEMAQVYKLPRADRFRAVTLPAVLPFALAAIRTNLGLAWKAAISGEVMAIVSGTIGGRLYDAKVQLETPDLFAWTAVVILLSLLLERLVLAGVGRLYSRLMHTPMPRPGGGEGGV